MARPPWQRLHWPECGGFAELTFEVAGGCARDGDGEWACADAAAGACVPCPAGEASGECGCDGCVEAALPAT